MVKERKMSLTLVYHKSKLFSSVDFSCIMSSHYKDDVIVYGGKPDHDLLPNPSFQLFIHGSKVGPFTQGSFFLV